MTVCRGPIPDMLEIYHGQRAFRHAFTRDFGYVQMVGEHYDLSLSREVAKGLQHQARTMVIRGHKNIIQYHRQINTSCTP